MFARIRERCKKVRGPRTFGAREYRKGRRGLGQKHKRVIGRCKKVRGPRIFGACKYRKRRRKKVRGLGAFRKRVYIG
jgi:hypothetical protein